MTRRRYFSHLRKGLRAGMPDGLSTTASLELVGTDGRQTVTPALTIAGPETMRGLAPSAIRTQFPPERSSDMRAGSLPYIEFHDPALPWLLSFEAPQPDGVQPFIGLLAIPQTNVVLDLSHQPCPRARITGLQAPLPPVTAFTLCAHVEDTGGQNGPPGPQAFSRILCPQLLTANTTYVALLVPLYARGAQGGLGRDLSGQPGDPAWPQGAMDADVPVYAHWTFTAGPGRGAEDILCDLRAVPPAGDAAPIPVDEARTAPHIPSPPEQVIKRAILSVRPAPATREDAMLPALDKTTALGIRRLPLPSYGEGFTAMPVSARAAPAWFKDINLDPSLRTMAGHGVALMQRHQDEIIGFVRDEAGDFETANAVLARAHGAMAANRTRHAGLSGAPLDALCRLAGPAAVRIRVGRGSTRQSLADRINGTVEGTLGLAAVRRSMASGGCTFPAGRAAAGDPAMADAVAGAALGKRNAPALPGADVLGSTYTVIQRQSSAPALVGVDVDIDRLLGTLADNAPPTSQPADEDGKIGRETYLRDSRRPSVQPVPVRADKPLRDTIFKALDPTHAVPPRIAKRIKGVDLSAPQPLPARLTVDPVWPKDILSDLLSHAPELISPSLAALPADGVMALSFDQAAIAALVAGANHELLREIRWRGLPVDGTPSPIRRVFPAPTTAGARLSPDVPPISDWRGGAGDAFGAHAPGLVILIRSALFKRFPETLITLYRANWDGALRTPDRTGMIAPIATGNVGPDAMYFAFPVSADEMRGDPAPDKNQPGGFLVFEQPDGGLTFGLNQTASDGATWNALSWQDLSQWQITGAAFSGTREGLSWGANSASMAIILQERPVTLALHVSDMIEGGA